MRGLMLFGIENVLQINERKSPHCELLAFLYCPKLT